MAISKFPIVIN